MLISETTAFLQSLSAAYQSHGKSVLAKAAAALAADLSALSGTTDDLTALFAERYAPKRPPAKKAAGAAKKKTADNSGELVELFKSLVGGGGNESDKEKLKTGLEKSTLATLKQIFISLGKNAPAKKQDAVKELINAISVSRKSEYRK